MSFPTNILTGTTIADADLPGLQAAQVNPYGTLLRRHISVQEFRALSGNLAINDTIPSRHFGGVVNGDNPATCIGTFDNYAASDKGLRLLYVTGAITERKIRLPDQFDLNHADHGGNATNILMYFWLTEKVRATANIHAIAGYGYQTTSAAQWMFDYDGAADNYRIRVANAASGYCTKDFGPFADDAPTLVGVHIRPIIAGSNFWKITGYVNGVSVGDGDITPAFPFKDLSAVDWLGNPPYPIIGRRGGYNVGHDCVVHTVGLARITGDDDVAAFMAAEYAKNAAALA